MSNYHLELSDSEAKELWTALSIRLIGMREELVHTDDRAYRASLKEATERLELVYQRLEQIMSRPTPGG